MPITYPDARDAIQTMFWSYWQANAAAANDGDGVPPVEWENKEQGAAPDPRKPYARFTLQTEVTPQVTLGPTGGRRFRTFGFVTVQIFTPHGEDVTRSDALAVVAKNAFQGKNSGSDEVTFREVRIIPVGRGDSAWQVNVLAAFDWDEVK